ncbi:aspartate aminotransferase, partial [Tribonema minus]
MVRRASKAVAVGSACLCAGPAAAFVSRPGALPAPVSSRSTSLRHILKCSLAEKPAATKTSFNYDDAISPLIAGISPSKTIEVHALTKEMEAAGEPVVSLCVGEPDFAPPAAVIEATAQAARAGMTKYTGVTGTAPLRAAICADLLRRKGVQYEPAEIVVSNGAKQDVFQAVLAVVRPGDEVIIPAPYWPSYPEIVRMAGGTPVIVDTDVSEGFLLSADALRAAITPKTRMLIFCNPSNPTGAVHARELCEELAAVLREPAASKVWVLADEIYERIVYDVPHYSFVAIPGMKERTMLINGFSKSHAMTGYRLGYMAAPLPIVKAVTTIQGQITSCASSIGQAAGLAALGVADEEMQLSFDTMRRKRDFVMERLRRIPKINVAEPQGAFYVLPDVSAYYGMHAPDGTLIDGPTPLCLYLLRAHKVALVTGEGFGYFNGVRLSYATSMHDLTLALNELEQCLASLQ